MMLPHSYKYALCRRTHTKLNAHFTFVRVNRCDLPSPATASWRDVKLRNSE